jgi:hypothetical protein
MNVRIGVLLFLGLAGLASATIIAGSGGPSAQVQPAVGTAALPTALQGGPGPQGPMGPRGPAGSGALLWRDANGRVIGPPDIDAGGPHYVLLTYAGLRVHTPMFANIRPWGTGTFENPLLAEQVPRAYYETADCTGTAYFSILRQPYMTLGTDAPAEMGINAQGQIYLVILDPQAVQQQRMVRCYRDKDQITPFPGPGAVLQLSSRALMVTPPLSTLYPGPLTLR